MKGLSEGIILDITEVRIKLMANSEDRLRGFCSITFDDCFVVRDLKIIEGNNGPFVAMPSRKLSSNCPKCRTKNHLRANYCNSCGNKLKMTGVTHDSSGRAKLYADIAHPVNAACREMIQNRVIEELNRELELSRQPGYKSRYDDDYDDSFDDLPQQPPAKDSSTTERTDPASTQHSQPHDSQSQDSQSQDSQSQDSQSHDSQSQGPDVSSGRSKPSSEGFGTGVFD
jgi:stage V sporulation protein G